MFRVPDRIPANVDPNEGSKLDESKAYDVTRRNHQQRIEELQQSDIVKRLEQRYGIDPNHALSKIPVGFYEKNNGTPAARAHFNRLALSSQIAKGALTNDPEKNRALVAGQEIMMYANRADYFNLVTEMYEQKVASIDSNNLRGSLDALSFDKDEYNRISSIIDKLKPTSEYSDKDDLPYRKIYEEKEAEGPKMRTMTKNIYIDQAYLNGLIDTYANGDAPEKQYLISLRDTLVELEDTDPITAIKFRRNQSRAEQGTILGKLLPYVGAAGKTALGGVAGVSIVADIQKKQVSTGTAILVGLFALLGNKDALKSKDQKDLEDTAFLASVDFQNLMMTYQISGELFGGFASDIMNKRGNLYSITKAYLKPNSTVSLNDVLETVDPKGTDPKFENFKKLASNKKSLGAFVDFLEEADGKGAKTKVVDRIENATIAMNTRSPEAKQFTRDFIEEGANFGGFAGMESRV